MLEHTQEAKRFYNSKAWKQCRKSYISKVFGLCERCSNAGYILDHVIELNSQNIHDPDITLNHKNLQYLCLPCHNSKTFRKNESIKDGFGFDDEGNFIQLG